MIAHSLTNLTKGHPVGKGKGEKVEATAECEEALKRLKEELMRDVCLKYPDFSKEFVLTTDASSKGVGAHL